MAKQINKGLVNGFENECNFVLAAESPAIANSPRSFLTPGYLALSGLETMVCATQNPPL